MNDLNNYLGKHIIVNERGCSQKNGSFERTYSGTFYEYLDNNWIMVGNNGICLLSYSSAVTSIKCEDKIVYLNPNIKEEFETLTLEELFEENIKMFGKDETIKLFKERINLIKQNNKELASEYKMRLSL